MIWRLDLDQLGGMVGHDFVAHLIRIYESQFFTFLKLGCEYLR